jgi:hypothetical protein
VAADPPPRGHQGRPGCVRDGRTRKEVHQP